MPGMSSNNFIRLIDQWALQKQAEDPGTSHPSGKADDGTQSVSTGARASENEKDVKAAVPTSVDAASVSQASGAGRGENTPTLHTGLESAATGEDASAETGRTKDKKEDPGTSHPSGAVGEKYASVHQLGNNILADIAIASASKPAPIVKEAAAAPVVKEAAAAPKAEVKKEDDKKTCACGKTPCECPPPVAEKAAEAAQVKQAAVEAREAGYKAGQELAKAASFDADKNKVVESIIKAAAADADNAIAYLLNFAKVAAEDEAKEGNPADEPQDKDIPKAPEEAAGAGAPPPQAGGGQEAELEQVLQALLEAGVTPEELLALAQQVQAGGAGAGAPPAGAPPVEAGAPPAGGMEVAASAKSAAAVKNDRK